MCNAQVCRVGTSNPADSVCHYNNLILTFLKNTNLKVNKVMISFQWRSKFVHFRVVFGKKFAR